MASADFPDEDLRENTLRTIAVAISVWPLLWVLWAFVFRGGFALSLTGLALLTYLGAGYTHTQGRYAETVGQGLDYLIREQKPDGDLRGRSRVVGMYCHAMATLALCEGYALTGDPRLRAAATRAVAFLVGARARDRLAWRYAPGAPVGDTSILGWVVMGLKSAKEVGIPIPDEASVRRGTLAWLDQVATGQAKGLARYQPQDSVTPTMTAEAWVCRQFLGVGGTGPASTEAAERRSSPDRRRRRRRSICIRMRLIVTAWRAMRSTSASASTCRKCATPCSSRA